MLGWHVSILGTDINQKFLARARDGRYDQWAFRATPENIRQECFVAVGKQWQIKPEYKAMVSFQYHNLTRNRFPSITDNIAAFDIIICRNVVIYFSRETVEALVPCFRESLTNGGWLVMGHAEPNMELFRSFRTVNCPGAVLYQRVDGEAPETPPPALRPPPPLRPPGPAARPPQALQAGTASAGRGGQGHPGGDHVAALVRGARPGRSGEMGRRLARLRYGLDR